MIDFSFEMKKGMVRKEHAFSIYRTVHIGSQTAPLTGDHHRRGA